MSRNSKSVILVVVELVTLFYLFLSGPVIPGDSFFFLLFIIGLSLAFWAMYSFRTTKFNLLPEVPENAALVAAGPYRIIRHPMYLSVMLIALSLFLNAPTGTRLLALLVLVGVLLVKTEMEEKYLDNHFKEYGAYKSQTQKLIPYLY